MAREGAYIPPHRRGRLLDLDRPLYARQPLKTRGETIGVGEIVDWQGLEIAKASIQRMFRLRYVSHYPKGDQSPDAIRDHRASSAQRTVPKKLEEIPAPEEQPKSKRQKRQ